jgi:phage terminase large subunit-like protein
VAQKFKRKSSVISSDEALLLKKAELQLLEKKLELREGLPHLNAFNGKWYAWARKFFDSTNHECFLTAGNQASKSSTQIRKIIHWATEPSLWPKLWNPDILVNGVPNTFWYMYPTADVATIEFEQKWEPMFMPRGKFKDDPQYGWEINRERGDIKSISFKSGVTIYFKTYGQKVQDLQTGTAYYVACDEELLIEIFPEVQARLNATNGYFSMAFTATLGQLYWENVIEPKNPDDEKHKDALKIQVSLLDCLKYDDGTKSHWTLARIQQIIDRCISKAEVDRRVHGRFVKIDGLRFPAFDRDRNVCKAHDLSGWHVYTGIDPGSGGTSGHPTAIGFVAVSPDYKHARAFKAWRGDKIATTSTDILDKYRELRGNLRPVMQRYDYENKDFFMVAARQGEAFVPADKNRESGYGLFNTLLKTGMLKIFDEDPELQKLIGELCTVPAVGDKRHFLDDLVDAFRYTLNGIPFDFSDCKTSVDPFKLETLFEKPYDEREERRKRTLGLEDEKDVDSISDELDFWQEQAGVD